MSLPEPADNPSRQRVDITAAHVAAAAEAVNAAQREADRARRALHAALDARAALPGRQRGQCGTPAGRRRHERAHQPACPACAEAKAWEKNRYTARRRQRAA